MRRINYIVENYLSNFLRENDFTREFLLLTMNHKKRQVPCDFKSITAPKISSFLFDVFVNNVT